ncbi:MAG: type II toxin-antitoxin system death-on-curing family toxin [Solirubrobacteraceae bacterium]
MSDELDYLSVEDLLEVAIGVIDGDVVVRDRGLLASAAARPRTSAFGDDAYPRFAEKAAALMHSLARNHALIDGNKRLAWAATRVFCLLNGRDLVFTVNEAEQVVLSVAKGDLDAAALAEVLTTHLLTDDRS